MTLHSTYYTKQLRILWVLVFFALCFSHTSFAQQKTFIGATVDTTAIRIGEEIKYTLTAEVDQTATVIFP